MSNWINIGFVLGIIFFTLLFVIIGRIVATSGGRKPYPLHPLPEDDTQRLA